MLFMVKRIPQLKRKAGQATGAPGVQLEYSGKSLHFFNGVLTFFLLH